MRRASPKQLARLRRNVLSNCRETLYKMLQHQHGGMVPCFVCGKHVKKGSATVEHILPRSLGGTDEMDNLSISHYQCNQARGNNTEFSWETEQSEEG